MTKTDISAADIDTANTDRAADINRAAATTVDPGLSTGEFPDYMLKEIYEQPRVLQDILTGRYDAARQRLVFDEITLTADEIRSLRHICIIACGTSFHAGLIAKDFVERLTDLTVDVQIASEFLFNQRKHRENAMVIAISQSGMTSDTLDAVQMARANGAYVVAITNVMDSTITTLANASLYIQADIEIAVPATKSYTAQLAILTLLALYLGQERGTQRPTEVALFYAELLDSVDKIVRILASQSLAKIEQAAAACAQAENILLLGRGTGTATCKEAALKVKETSYRHAEAFSVLEFVHGPIALIDPGVATPVVALLPADSLDDATRDVLFKAKAYGAKLIVFTEESEQRLVGQVDYQIFLPKATPIQMPFVAIVALQLFARHIACILGCDIDNPRYLSKVVVSH
ncbi:MAG: SIS domain-containing protein [Coriobacteriales bacterium]|nr:SIS domain-containing protein [Coriobacteriales bacterium]